MPLDDQALLRYSRQILLPELDLAGQQRLSDARVLIIGLGGLGSPAALYLAGSGIGAIDLADADRVELSNLPRQILHEQGALGQRKVDSARKRLRAQNPGLQLRVHAARLAGDALRRAVAAVDLVLDCSDSLASRKAINRACLEQGRPLVSGAAIRWEGQISLFDPRRAESPCYECLYGALGSVSESCADNGVIGPVTGVIGSLQAVEAIKAICSIGDTLIGRVLLVDAYRMHTQIIELQRDPDCPACRNRPGSATAPRTHG